MSLASERSMAGVTIILSDDWMEVAALSDGEGWCTLSDAVSSSVREWSDVDNLLFLEGVGDLLEPASLNDARRFGGLSLAM